jgi:hypothetical protein
MFERFGSPCVIAAASVIVLAATPAAAQGTPTPTPAPDAAQPPPGAPPPSSSGTVGGSLSTGLSLGASAEAPPVAPAAGGTETVKVEEKWEAPFAGYNGAFYIRSKDDVFQTWINGRFQFDFVKSFAAGAYDAGLLSGFLVRRARIENAGCFGDFCYSIQPEFGPTSTANTLVARADSTVFNQPNQAPAARNSSILATAFINYKIHPLFQLMAGIVQTPFGLESRQSTKYKDFLEDGIATKFAVQNGTEQGLTAWGASDKNMFNYEVGVFSGDSSTRPNMDNRFDFIGRIFARPLAGNKGALEKFQIGVSGKYGERDRQKVNYDYSPISTANGFALWTPTYTGPAPGGPTSGLLHIIPTGAQSSVGGELRIPIENFDLTGEFTYVNNKTREEYDARLGSRNYERFGSVSGTSFYAAASYWIGKRDIYGEPGFFRISRLVFKKPEAAKAGDAKPKGPDTAWRIRVRYDNVSATYKSAEDGGKAAARTIATFPQPVPFYDGDIKIHAFQAGVDYFYTKNFGFRLNYGLYYTPDSAPSTPEPGSVKPVATEVQRAQAPANRLAAGIDDAGRRGAHSIHELILRAQVAF